MAEALEVVIGQLKLLEDRALSQKDKDSLRIFLGDISAIRKIKTSYA
ncbi:MAG TPA: hypothetical protein VLA61_09525 [Ideonella sp.]|nr:hypothetical protein [Ideonella sp.]HSI48497.1 hypothetical protein [Ideonella sp.]